MTPDRPALDPEREPFALGDWQVDAPGNRLRRGDEIRPLRHKAMALLVMLARRPGETVTRDEIVDAIWNGNRFVAPKAINTAVWTIRQALGDDPDAPRYLETIAKKGYRLIAAVAPIAVAGPASALPELPHAPPETSPATNAPRRGPWLVVAAASLFLLTAAIAWQLMPRASTTTPQPLLTATPLTQNPGLEYLGRLSPDGRLLAFAWWQQQGVGQLYLRPADDLSAAPQPVSGDAGEVQGLAWSPDGRSIAFTAVVQGRCTLWVHTLSDQSRRPLAECSAMFTPTLDWSPDGRWIAFSAAADGAGGLFLIGPDGQALRRLTTAPPAAMGDHQPAWSPDGRRIAFARQDPADGTRDLHEVTLDGQVRRLSTLRLYTLHGLTYAAGGQDIVFSTTRQDTRVLMRWDRAASVATPLGLEGSAPALAADGRLVYALLRSHVSVAKLAWDDRTPQRYITSVATDRSADVSATDGRIAFLSRRSGDAELWVSAADGQQPRAVTQLQGQLASPAWSPGGDRIAFLGHCGPGRRYGLCLLDVSADGTPGALRPIAADAAHYGRPAWHPGSGEVWVASDRGGRWQLWRFAANGGTPGVAVSTMQPPGRALAWAVDGSALFYQPMFSGSLRRWTPGGAERELRVAADGDTLVDWRIGTDGLVALVRGNRERFLQLDPAGGVPRVLADHALGTFPELATFSLAPDGSARVDIANTAVADLMQAR